MPQQGFGQQQGSSQQQGPGQQQGSGQQGWTPPFTGSLGTNEDLASPPKERIVYVLFGLFLGGLGVHNFYAGYNGRAVAQLVLTLFFFWLIIPILVVGIWVLVEVITVTKDARGVPFV